MRYAHVLRTIQQTPWAIVPSQLTVILDIVRTHTDGEVDEQRDRGTARGGAGDAGPARRRARRAAAARATSAVLPIYGTIVPRATMFTEMSGGVSVEQISAAFRQSVQDPQVKAIVLDIDSPGGSATGIPELAAEIRAARGTKPIVAVANYVMASGAYWLAAQADEIVASKSALVGSIGVYGVHEDQSERDAKDGVKVTMVSAGKFKTEANPHEPLSAEATEHMQAFVDENYEWFVGDVAAGRRVSFNEVLHGFGEGRVVTAPSAVELGMVDSIGTLEETLARVVSDVRQPARRGARANEFAADAGAVHDRARPPARARSRRR